MNAGIVRLLEGAVNNVTHVSKEIKGLLSVFFCFYTVNYISGLIFLKSDFR